MDTSIRNNEIERMRKRNAKISIEVLKQKKKVG